MKNVIKLTKPNKDYTIIKHFCWYLYRKQHMEKSPSLVEGARLEIV